MLKYVGCQEIDLEEMLSKCGRIMGKALLPLYVGGQKGVPTGAIALRIQENVADIDLKLFGQLVQWRHEKEQEETNQMVQIQNWRTNRDAMWETAGFVEAECAMIEGAFRQRAGSATELSPERALEVLEEIG